MKAFRTAFVLVSTNFFVPRNSTAPRIPDSPGATTHAANTCDTPSHPQLTLVMPTEADAAPTSPPMMECVVDTGSPLRVAMLRKTDDPKMAHIMTRRRTLGRSS